MDGSIKDMFYTSVCTKSGRFNCYHFAARKTNYSLNLDLPSEAVPAIFFRILDLHAAIWTSGATSHEVIVIQRIIVSTGHESSPDGQPRVFMFSTESDYAVVCL